MPDSLRAPGQRCPRGDRGARRRPPPALLRTFNPIEQAFPPSSRRCCERPPPAKLMRPRPPPPPPSTPSLRPSVPTTSPTRVMNQSDRFCSSCRHARQALARNTSAIAKAEPCGSQRRRRRRNLIQRRFGVSGTIIGRRAPEAHFRSQHISVGRMHLSCFQNRDDLHLAEPQCLVSVFLRATSSIQLGGGLRFSAKRRKSAVTGVTCRTICA